MEQRQFILPFTIETALKKEQVGEDEIFIPDECGDSLWDAVLAEQVNAFDVKVSSKNSASLAEVSNDIEEVRTNKS